MCPNRNENAQLFEICQTGMHFRLAHDPLDSHPALDNQLEQRRRDGVFGNVTIRLRARSGSAS
jgi:hypothetical protein